MRWTSSRLSASRRGGHHDRRHHPPAGGIQGPVAAGRGPASREPGLAGRAAMVNTSGLGYVQRAALKALTAGGEQAAADLRHLSAAATPEGARKALNATLRLLEGRGLTVVARTVPAVPWQGGGRPTKVYAATDEGRALARRTT